MPRSLDELADSFRADFSDAHAAHEAYTGPHKRAIGRLLGIAHAGMAGISHLIGDDEGEGLIVNRVGDDKD